MSGEENLLCCILGRRKPFDGEIPNLVDIELLMSVHKTLIRPTLAPDQHGIDGIILHRLFKNKPVYIRPNCELLNTSDSTGQREQKESQDQVLTLLLQISTGRVRVFLLVPLGGGVFEDTLWSSMFP